MDRVNLDAGRRDYLEYRFGTVLTASRRNYGLGGIPYYIWIGKHAKATTESERYAQQMIEEIDASLTQSPYLSPRDHQAKMIEGSKKEEVEVEVRSKAYESAVVNLAANLPLPAAFYQNHQWRICYDDRLEKHTQFNDEYIYAFNWYPSTSSLKAHADP